MQFEINLDEEVLGFELAFAQREVGKDIETTRYPKGYEFSVDRVAVGLDADGKITLFPRSYTKVLVYDLKPGSRKKPEVYTFGIRPDLDREALGASRHELVAIYARDHADALATLWARLKGG